MRLQYFLVGFLASIPLWWFGNIFQKDLEDFLFWELTKGDFEAFSAAVSPGVQFTSPKPLRNKELPELSPDELSARAAFIFHIQNDGRNKILFQKNPDRALPVASLTKLMTAYIAANSYELADSFTISEEAVSKEEDFGQLRAGETLRVGDLLWILLMESSNDAAWVLAENFSLENKRGVDAFVEKMNNEAARLGMMNTFFSNPSGVDPDSPEEKITRSSARDLAILVTHLLQEQPLLLKILGTQEIDLYAGKGEIHHTLQNTTNGFASDIPRFLGAKTGFTPLAKQNLLLIQENPWGNGYIVYVLLGSNDRFGEMEKLVGWVDKAWRW